MVKVERYKYNELPQHVRDTLTAVRDAQIIYDNPFFDLDFAGLMSDVRDDTEILLISKGGNIVGYWALHVRPDKWCRPLGGPFSDWHGPVISPDMSIPSADELLALAGLKGLSAHGLQPFGFGVSDRSAITPVSISGAPESADAFLAWQKSLFPKHAKNMRRAARLANRDYGEAVLTLDDESVDAFNQVMDMKQAQYRRTGLHNVLAPDWAQDMMNRLRLACFPRLRARLSTLKLGGQLAAGEFNLLSDTVIHGWIVVYDPEFAAYSPGHMLMQAIICDMRKTGHMMYDAGSGNHDYKKVYETYQVPMVSRTLRSGLGHRPICSTWCWFEQKFMPSRLATLMQSARRRGDQIFSSELDRRSRIRGVINAARKFIPISTKS